MGFTSKESAEKYSFPATHWLMMGLAGNGGYSQEDADFTMSFATKEERQKANIEEIQNRLSQMGGLGYVKLLNRKAVYTWADGTYYSSAKLAVTPLHDGTLAQIFRLDGKYNTAFQIYTTAYQTILLIGLAFAYIYRIVRPKWDVWTMALLSVSGLAVFLFLWEDRSRYLINFFPVLLLCSIYGMKKCFAFLQKRKGKKNHQIKETSAL